MDGPTIDASMLAPLLLMAGAYTFYYFWVLMVRVRGELIAQKVRVLQMKQAQGNQGDMS